MSDFEKQKLFKNYKLPAFTAVLVMLLIIVNAYNNRDKSDQWQDENSKLTAQIEELTSTTQQLLEQNGSLAKLDKKISEQEKASVELSSAIGQMTADSKAASAALAYIERKLKKTKAKLQTAQDSILARTTELAELPNDAPGDMAKKIEEQGKKYAELNSTVEQMGAKKKAADAALAYIERKVSKAKTKLAAIQHNILYKITELSDLQNRADTLQRQIVATKNDFDQLQTAQVEIKQKSETLHKEINTVEKAIASKTAVLDSLELLNRMHPVIEKSIQVMTQNAQKKEIAQQARLEALQGIIAEANANLIIQQEKFVTMGEELDTQVQAFKVTKQHSRDDE
jgi:chromosome segregation ATPase